MNINNNPFLQGAESIHEYKGRYFVVDYFEESNMWQCSDAKFHMRTRGKTKEEVIVEMHKWWDLQIGGQDER
jgi:hypothetical protein